MHHNPLSDAITSPAPVPLCIYDLHQPAASTIQVYLFTSIHRDSRIGRTAFIYLGSRPVYHPEEFHTSVVFRCIVFLPFTLPLPSHCSANLLVGMTGLCSCLHVYMTCTFIYMYLCDKRSLKLKFGQTTATTKGDWVSKLNRS